MIGPLIVLIKKCMKVLQVWIDTRVRIFIFGWTFPLTNALAFMLGTMHDGRSLVVAFTLFWVNKSMASVVAEVHMLSENQRQEEAF